MTTALMIDPFSNSVRFGNLCQPLMATLAGSIHRLPGGISIPLRTASCNATYGLPTKARCTRKRATTSLSFGRQSYGGANGTTVPRRGANSDPRKRRAFSRRPS